MCLETKQIEPKMATEDIICYKLLKCTNDGEYVTPYQKMKVSENIINGKAMMKPQEEKLFDKIIKINGGCIHSYANNHIPLPPADDYVLFKCVIPMGALYYEGENSEYASSELRFIGIDSKTKEKILVIEDLPKLDWNRDVEKELIKDIFLRNHFFGWGETETTLEILSRRCWEAYNKINDIVLFPIIDRVYRINPDIEIDYQYAYDLYQKYLGFFPEKNCYGLDKFAVAAAMVVNKITAQKCNLTPYLNGMIKWAKEMEIKFKEEGLFGIVYEEEG